MMRQMEWIYDNRLNKQTENDYMVKSTISEFDSEIKSASMLKITEI